MPSPATPEGDALLGKLTSAVEAHVFAQKYQNEHGSYPHLRELLTKAVGDQGTLWWTGQANAPRPSHVKAFGHKCHPDGLVSCAGRVTIAIEAKLITPSSADGMFHSLIQGIIYAREFEQTLVIVLDQSGHPDRIGPMERALLKDLQAHSRMSFVYRRLDG